MNIQVTMKNANELLRGKTDVFVPFCPTPVSAGFPAPTDGSIETSLNLNEHCIRNPLSTYFARVSGEGWSGLGVARGDELIVDRGLDPADGSLVLADIDGSRSLFRVSIRNHRMELIDASGKHFGPEDGIALWGTVTYVIRKMI